MAEDKTENMLAIREIAKLAKESNLAVDFDFAGNGIKQDDIYFAMAKNVFEQLDSLPEEQRAAVAMASMTKLLVENFCVTTILRGLSNEQQN